MGCWGKIGSREELAAPALWKRKMKCREIKDCEEQVEYAYRYISVWASSLWRKSRACGAACSMRSACWGDPFSTDVICLQVLPVSHKSAYPGITYRQVRDWFHLVGNWSRTGSPLPFFYHDIPIVNIQQSIISLILMRQIHYKNL
jgi:hypothetical protein